jgi:hypothetical protein
MINYKEQKKERVAAECKDIFHRSRWNTEVNTEKVGWSAVWFVYLRSARFVSRPVHRLSWLTIWLISSVPPREFRDSGLYQAMIAFFHILPKSYPLSSSHSTLFNTLSCWKRLAEVKIMLRPTVSRPVCFAVKHPVGTQAQNFYYCQTSASLLMWGALSDEGAGLSFTIPSGPRQRSHSRVQVSGDSWLWLIENPPTWRARSPHLYPPEQGSPVIPPGTGFFFIGSYDSQGYVFEHASTRGSLVF